MSNCRLTPQAAEDLNGIHDMIAAERPAAAARMIAALERRCELLADFPEMGARLRLRPLGLRYFAVKRYLIVYRPVEDGIQVIRFLHGSRDLSRVFRPVDPDDTSALGD
jgi:toxin ParE1/3/4